MVHFNSRPTFLQEFHNGRWRNSHEELVNTWKDAVVTFSKLNTRIRLMRPQPGQPVCWSQCLWNTRHQFRPYYLYYINLIEFLNLNLKATPLSENDCRIRGTMGVPMTELQFWWNRQLLRHAIVTNFLQYPSLKVNLRRRRTNLETSGWFRRNSSTTDPTFCIRQILEKKREYNETVHQLFVDFKKTYDSVWREILYSILLEFEVPMKLVWLNKMCSNEILVH
jgi:hypothetical protein